MKGRMSDLRPDHVVPLSSNVLSVLDRVKAFTEDGYIFPGGKNGKPLSENAMLALLRRMKRKGLTVHGFRASFRAWAAECTLFPPEVAEAALDHTISDKVMAAYQRGTFLKKRAELMNAWARYCGCVQQPGKVIEMKRRQAK